MRVSFVRAVSGLASLLAVSAAPGAAATSGTNGTYDPSRIVESNTTGYQFSTIDPSPVVDATGNSWSSWGSGFGKVTSKLQTHVTRMASSGLPLSTEPGTPRP